MYRCPRCGQILSLSSNGLTLTCKNCKLVLNLLKTFKGSKTSIVLASDPYYHTTYAFLIIDKNAIAIPLEKHGENLLAGSIFSELDNYTVIIDVSTSTAYIYVIAPEGCVADKLSPSENLGIT